MQIVEDSSNPQLNLVVSKLEVAAQSVVPQQEFVKKKALITGATGQDAAYLSKFLLDKGYEVHLSDRRVSADERRYWRLSAVGVQDRVKIAHATLSSLESLVQLLHKVQPDEVYNLAAMSFVANSFEDEYTTLDTNFWGVYRLLSAIREYNTKIRFYQAGTSEMFGQVEEPVQNESTKFHPRSPYGISKVGAHYTTMYFRERYGMFAVNGILFNHESPLRSVEFFTRKVIHGLIHAICTKEKLKVGNLEARRDWGYAKEYVEAMYLMLQQEAPEDFVIASGQIHTCQEFLTCALARINSELEFNYTQDDLVEVDPNLFRPCEVDVLLGDATKAKEKLEWKPKTSFHELVNIMVDVELDRFDKELQLSEFSP